MFEASVDDAAESEGSVEHYLVSLGTVAVVSGDCRLRLRDRAQAVGAAS